MRRRLFGATILVLFLLAGRCAHAQATCFAVTPSGAGSQNGSSWSNALAGLPSTLTRGAIYYLADGSYGTYTFSTAASGTATVEIRKAQSYDFGNGGSCTSSIGAGWNAITMGSSQAQFSGSPGFKISAPYLILNGNGQQSASGCGGAPGISVSAAPPIPTDCGINVTDTANEAVSSGSSNATVEYVELLGHGTNNSSSFAEVAGGGSPSNTTWNHIYGHNAGCVYFQYTGSNRTVSNSYFWGTEVQGNASACHGQYSFDISVSNLKEFNNIYRDITGTAIWTLASFSGQQGVSNSIELYDNVVYDSSPTASWSPFLSDGVISCIANSGTGETEQCSNITMVQNDFVNLGSGASGINNDCTDGCGSGSSYTVENNIWYQSSAPSFTTAAPATYTQGYNSCLNSGNCSSGSNNTVVASSPNPFTSWAIGVFTLTSDNADWDNRTALGSPYNIDAAGNTFTTDRGAYQFSGSVAPPPQPATNLLATPH